MILVKCIDGNRPAWECNGKLAERDKWLNANCGRRWLDWDWAPEYGVAEFPPSSYEVATIFKLKFGI